MLFMFRLLLVAAGMVIVALAMTARGLVPEPEVRTRIGEVPSIGRALVQQAIAPQPQIARLSIDPTISEANPLGKVVAAPLAELVASVPTPETAPVPPTTEPASAGEPQGVVSGSVAAKTVETREDRQAASAGEQAPDRTTSAASEPSPSAAPEPSPSAASDAAALSPVMSAEKRRAADAPASADPPALAFGAEPVVSARTESVAGERSAAAPSKPLLGDDGAATGGSTKAKASDIQSGSESAAPAHSGKGKKSAREIRRKTAAGRNGMRARRAIATPAWKKVRIAKTAPRAKRRIPQQASSPADLKMEPEAFEYMFAAPPSSTAAPSGSAAAPSSGPSQGAN